jgi:hypothetical protein
MEPVHIHKSLTLVPILNQMNLVHTLTPCSLRTIFLSHVCNMRVYYDGKKCYFKILTDLHVLSTTEYESRVCIRWYWYVERSDHVILMYVDVFCSPGYEKLVLGVPSVHLSMYVCKYGWMLC